MKISIPIYMVLLMIFFQQCSNNKENKPASESEIRKTEDALIGANRLLVKKDKEKIVNYIAQHNLSLQESSSGLWYGITKQGKGKQVRENMDITLAYKVSLLDGTVCYSSDSLGVKQFRVGKGGVESGLEEGVLMLHEGSSAIFILPPHLAHGLPGDGNRIPARSIIVYQVDILKVNP